MVAAGDDRVERQVVTQLMCENAHKRPLLRRPLLQSLHEIGIVEDEAFGPVAADARLRIGGFSGCSKNDPIADPIEADGGENALQLGTGLGIGLEASLDATERTRAVESTHPTFAIMVANEL